MLLLFAAAPQVYASFEAQQGNHDMARDLYRRALSVDSTSRTTMHNRVSWAAMEAELGDLAAAATILSAAIDLHPDFPAALVAMAAVQRKLGRMEVAEAYVRRAMRASHAFYPQALKELQMIHAWRGERTLAANQARQLANVEAMLDAKRAGVWGSDAWAAYFDASRSPEQRALTRAAQQRKAELGLIRRRDSPPSKQPQQHERGAGGNGEAAGEEASAAPLSVEDADLIAATAGLFD